MQTRGDYEILASGGAFWLLPCALLLLVALAPLAHDPIPADRLANLAIALDDPIVAEIPIDGRIRLRPDQPSLGEVFWELSSDHGATYTGLRTGHDLTIGTTDGAVVGSYVRPSRFDAQRGLIPMKPYVLIESTLWSEQAP